MRTTITLDPDVHRLLLQVAHKSKRPFKQVLNEVVRSSPGGNGAAKPCAQPVYSPGRSRIDMTKALSVIDAWFGHPRASVLERLTFLPALPHHCLLIFCVINPRSLLHLQHSFCLRSF